MSGVVRAESVESPLDGALPGLLRVGCDLGHPLAGEASELRHLRRAETSRAPLYQQILQLCVSAQEGVFGLPAFVGCFLNLRFEGVHAAHGDTPHGERATWTRLVIAKCERYSHSRKVKQAMTEARAQQGLVPCARSATSTNKGDTLTNLSLCSGAGTLDLAVEQITGGKTVVYAENDLFASRVMEARFPWATNVGDITTADWAGIAQHYQIESLTGGFSCQDISNAGRKAGIRGKRSGIWTNFAEAVGVIRPRLVFLENVEALRTKDRGLDVVLADLAAIGYDARWTCLRADEVGAPHRRWRWFCIAYPADAYPVSAGWHGGA